MRILVLLKYENLGASSRVRFLQYLPYLRAKGFEVDTQSFLDNSYITSIYANKKPSIFYYIASYLKRLKVLFRIKKYDLVWIQYESFPFLPAWFELWFFKHKKPYVVDYDDAVFHKYDIHPNIFVKKIFGKKIDKIMANAASVVVGNEYLANHARLAGAKRVEIVPSVIDILKYSKKGTANTGEFIIGWIGTTLASRSLNLISNALASFSKGKNVVFLLIGANNFAVAGAKMVYKDWSLELEAEMLANIDVGIMPLYDEFWERGKCGYKLIQYMACGKPVIASPVGVNKKIVDHGINGFLATNEAEWIKYLEILYSDFELRNKMGAAAREKVEKQYTIQANVNKLVEIFKSVTKA